MDIKATLEKQITSLDKYIEDNKEELTPDDLFKLHSELSNYIRLHFDYLDR